MGTRKRGNKVSHRKVKRNNISIPRARARARACVRYTLWGNTRRTHYWERRYKTRRITVEELNREKYRGAVICARGEKYVCGEQPTRRAVTAEKKYAMSKEIRTIEYNNQLRTCTNAIASAFVEYYRELFGSTTFQYDTQQTPAKVNWWREKSLERANKWGRNKRSN